MDATAQRQDLSRPFSIYLDLLRFLAALAVFVSHSYGKPFSDGLIWWRLAPYGTVSVTVFFVLSGYVISYVTLQREKTIKDYVVARLSRFYSVVLVALSLTFVLDHIGKLLNPDLYALDRVLWKTESWSGYLSSLFFLNEYQIFGFNGIAPGTNGPYWSMSFEATYYVIAGLFIFCRPLVWAPLSIIILYLAGSTITAMLPLWALGYWLFRIKFANHFSRKFLLVFLIFSFLLLALLPWYAPLKSFDNFGFFFPWNWTEENRNLGLDYLVAIAFGIHLLVARALFSKHVIIPNCLEKSIRWLGSLTFPLYLLHQPLLCLLAAVSPWKNTSVTHLLFLYASTLTAVALLTIVCDKLKQFLRDYLNSFVPGTRNKQETPEFTQRQEV